MKIQKKICLLGSDGVGKTSIIVRFTKGTFSSSYLVTLGVDFYENKFYRPKEENSSQNDELITQIWDLASQKSFVQMRSQYLSFSHFIVIVIDSDRTSEDFIEPWINDIHKHAGKDVPFLIALNKIDLLSAEEIEKLVNELEQKYSARVFPTSAKTGENINEMFNHVASQLW